jgi:hypothetical protein
MEPIYACSLQRVPIIEPPRLSGLIDRILELTSTQAPWYRRLWRGGTMELAQSDRIRRVTSKLLHIPKMLHTIVHADIYTSYAGDVCNMLHGNRFHLRQLCLSCDSDVSSDESMLTPWQGHLVVCEA